MMLSRCALLLLLSLASTLLHSSQNPGVKGDAEDMRTRLPGPWRGHSECTVKNSPCHDEVNVYRFSKVAGRANAFSVTASKEIVMGTAEWKYDERKGIVERGKPAIQLMITGDKMEGALKLDDGTVYRRIYLKKES